MSAARKTARAGSQKPSSPVTTRQTSGAGFTFEDLAAAWLLTKLLTGQSLPGIGTSGHMIQWQTAALGWEIDDLLLTGGSSAAPCRERR